MTTINFIRCFGELLSTNGFAFEVYFIWNKTLVFLVEIDLPNNIAYMVHLFENRQHAELI